MFGFTKNSYSQFCLVEKKGKKVKRGIILHRYKMMENNNSGPGLFSGLGGGLPRQGNVQVPS